MKEKPTKKHKKILVYEELEKRVLLSADAAPTADLSQVDEKIISEDIATPNQSDNVTDNEAQTNAETSEQAEAKNRWELVIINDNVTDYEQLVEDIQDNDDNRIIEVVVINSGQDGIDQVSAILADRQDLSAVHFIANGAEGQINVGNTWISSSNTANYTDVISEWGNSLTQEGDMLFYGCNITSGDSGLELLNTIADLTDADIAGSDDLTGHASLGADWDLEYKSGTIETELAVSQEAREQWVGALDVVTGLVGHWTFDTDASDSSGNNYDGTLCVDAAVDTDSGTNMVGAGKLNMEEAMDDGLADRVDLSAHIANFEGLTQGTISAWFKTSDSDSQTIFSINGGMGGDEITLSVWAGDLHFTLDYAGVGSFDIMTTSLNLDDGAWHHVAITVDGTGNNIYVDNQHLTSIPSEIIYFDGNASSSGFFNDASGLTDMNIGSTAVGMGLYTGEFNGLIDDVRIYNRALTSADVSELNGLGNHAPTATADSFTVDEGSTTNLDLAANDTDPDDGLDLTSINIVSDASNGNIVVNADGTVDYTHDGGETTSDSFTYTIDDLSGETSNTVTVSLTVTPVNDSPTIATNTGTTVAEGSTGTQISTAMLNEGDPDDSGAGLTYTLTTDVSNGTLKLNGSEINASDTFTQADIDAGLLTYDHNGGETSSDSFDFSLADGGEDGSTPATGTFNITVTAVNDAPVVTAPGSALAATEQVSLNIHGTGFGVSDSDEAGSGVLATLSVGEGTITIAAGDSGVTIDSGNGTSSVVLSGTAAQINNLLTGGGTGTITYLNNSDTPSGSTTFTVTVNDQGNTGADPGLTGDGSSEEGTNSQTINITAVNDSPTIATNTGATVAEGSTGTEISTAMLNEGDPDDSGDGLTYTLTTDVSNGILKLDGTELGASDTFTQADIDAGLLTYDHDGGETYSDSFNFSLADGGEDGSTPATGTFNITVTAVNDSPTIAINTGVTVAEGYTGTVITNAMLNEGDPDDSGAGLTYTLTADVSNGTLKLNGSEINASDTFTQADIDAGLLTYDHNGGETSSDSFDFSLADGGEDGSTPATGTFNITVTAVNDAPVVTAPGSALSATEQVSLNIHGTGFGVTDSDEAGSGVLATLSVGEGTITVAVGNSGVTIDSGNGTSSVVLSGTAAQINNLLTGGGTGTITYLNNSDTPSASTSFTVTVNDQGNTGADPGLTGDGSSEEGTNSQTINITAVNDSPTIATNTGTTVAEGSTGTEISTAMLNEGDPDDSGDGLTYTLTTDVSNGILKLDGTELGASDTFTQADIDAGLLTYDHDGGETSSDSFDFSLADGGEDGSTPATGTFNITVTAVNDSPTIATNTGTTVAEGSTNTQITNSMLNEGDPDDSGAGLTYTLTTDVSNGTLKLNGSEINASATFTQADIDAGLLTYDHDGGETSSDSFDFSLADGGEDGSTPATGTFNITVTAVNDAPVVTAPGSALSATEQVSLNIHGTGFAVSDSDEAGSGIIATLSVGDGDITVTAGDSGVTIDSGNGTSSVVLSCTAAQINNLLTGGGTGTITYLNNSDTPSASTSFTVTVNDQGNTGADPGLTGDGSSEEGTNSQTINITAVNDSPTIATNTGATVAEGSTNTQITNSMLNEGDPDDSGAGLTYTLTTDVSNGILKLDGTELGASDTFTQADIDAGLLTYDHDGGETYSDSFNFSLADGGEDGSTPATGTFNITVTAVNDSPTIATNTGVSVAEGYTGTVITNSMLNEGDPDDSGAGLTYTLTADVSNGTLKLNGSEINASDTFTQADIDAGLLTYDHDGTNTASDSFDFSLADGGEDGSTPATGTFNITVESGADLSITAPASSTTNEDTAVVYSGANVIQVDDGIAADTRLQVSLSVVDGTLTLNGTSGLDIVEGANGTSSMVIHGLESDINAALDGLSFTPDSNVNGSDSLSITTSLAGDLTGWYSFNAANADDDSAGTAQDGTLSGNATITNDAERGQVLSLDGDDDFVQINSLFGNPTDVTMSAWVNYTTADATGGEVISLGNNVILRVDDSTHGVCACFYNGSTWKVVASNVSLADGEWHHIAYTFDDTADTQGLYIDGVLVASGTETASISYDWDSYTRIGSHTNDGNNNFDYNGMIDDARIYTRALSGDEIAALAVDNTQATDNVSITVNAINDAPVITAPGSALSATEQVGLAIHGTGFGVTDVDAGISGLIATLAVGEGDITISAGDSGVTIDSGNGSSSVVLSGTAAQINNLLTGAGTGTITYLNNSDDPSASTSFTVTVNDQGNTGADPGLTGDGSSEEGTNSQTINITPVNDAPFLAIRTGVTVAEGSTGTVITNTMLNEGDPDDSGTGITYTMVSDVTNGILRLNGTDLNATDTFTQADIDAGLLTYDHDGGETANDVFFFNLADGGEDGTGPVLYNFDITVTAVNDSPTIATNTGATVTEGSTATQITNSMLNEGDPDDSGAGLTYTLTTDVSNGTLKLNGSEINASATFTQADIDAGLLTYDHDGTETNSDSFDFSLADGGEDGATPATGTFNITVTAVNDAPVVTAPGSALAATEQVSLNIHGTGFGVSDSDEAGSGVLATLSVGEGTITIAAGDSGVTIDSGNGTSSVVLSGTAAQINNLLTGGGTGTINYLNNSDTPSASTTFTVTVNDQGNTGADPGLTGDGSSEEGTNSQTINITAVNDSPTIATNTGVTVSEGSTGTEITTAMLNEGDPDDSGADLTYTLTADVSNGTLKLNGSEINASDTFTQSDIDAGLLTYDHDGTNTVSDSFDFSLADGGEDGATPAAGTFNITVTAVNESPTIATNTGTTVAEGSTATQITNSMLNEGDPDDSGAGLTYTLTTDVSNGTLKLNGSEINASDTFTQADIDAGLLTYDHDGGETSSDSFDFSLADGGEDGATPATGTFNITVTAVNDAPVVTAPGSALAATEQVSLNIHGTGFGVSDSDEAGSGVLATLSVGEGTITIAAGDSGITIDSGNGTSSVVLSGTAAQINNLLTGGGTGTINYLNNSDTPSASTSFTVTVNDQGNTGADPGLTGDGSSEESTNSQTINITAVNDSPTIATNTGVTVSEGSTGTEISTAMLNEGDPDDSGAGLTYTLTTDVSNGTLKLNGSEINASDTFTQADIDAGFLTYDHDGTETSSDSFDFSLADGEEDGSTPATGTFNITVTAVNDSPTIATNTGVTVAEGSTGTEISTAMLNEGDPDDSGAELTYTLTADVSNGTLKLNGSEINTSDTFTQADIDAGLLTYDHDGGETNSDSFDFSLADGGEDGATPATGTFNITVTAVNDAPVVTAPGSALSGTEQVSLDIHGTGFSVSDPDEAGSGIIATLSVGDGDITVTAGDSGVTIDSGNGTSSVVLSGTTAQINNLLTGTGTGTITYIKTTDNPSAPATFTVTINDQGNTGADPGLTGDGSSEEGTNSQTINITPVNDSPVIATNTGVTVAEGSTGTQITNAMLNEGDPDDSGSGLTYTLTTDVSNGTLKLNDSEINAGDTFTQSDIDAGLLTYDHNGGETNSDTFDFSLADGGEDGAIPAAGTFNITVTAVNDSPTIATNTGTTVAEGATGTQITNAMLNEGDPDDSGAGLTYSLTTDVSNGTLKLNNSEINAGDTFTQSDIDAGLLTYDHNGGETNSDSFDFSLADGGEDGSTPATGTFNITVTAVNDSPAIAVNTGLSITDGAIGTVITNTMLNEGDPDDSGADLTYTVTAEVSKGTLWCNGSVLRTGDTFTQADIDAGLVTYDNNGEGTSSDSFDFSLADGGEDSSIPATGTFNITVTADNPPPVDLPPDPNNTETITINMEDETETPDMAMPEITQIGGEGMEQSFTLEDNLAPPLNEPSTNARTNQSAINSVQDNTEESLENLHVIDEGNTDSEHKNQKNNLTHLYPDHDRYYVETVLAQQTSSHPDTEKDIVRTENTKEINFENNNTESISQATAFDQVRISMDEEFDDEKQSETFKHKVASVSIASFSAGIVSYLMRAGSMLSSMIFSMPIWRGFDPVAIFTGKKKKPKDKNTSVDNKEHQGESFFDDTK